MQTKKLDTHYMATLAMLAGVLLAMGLSGIGFIPLPVIKATTMHIPVILGAILLGPGAGAFLGGVFGLCSVWVNTTAPGLLAFAFSPFMSTTGIPGVFKSLWIAMGCRILFGFLAGLLWKGLRRLFRGENLALIITAAVSTLCHTILVMGSIYLLLAPEYAAAKNVAMEAVLGLVMGTVTASGIPEALAAAILVPVIAKALLRLMRRRQARNG